jgi:hypothetical protein
VTDKYEFIDAEYAAGAAGTGPAPALSQMCSWLEVSRSGFYDRKSRPESAAARRRNDLTLLISKIFEDSDGTYGYRRVARAGRSVRPGSGALRYAQDKRSMRPVAVAGPFRPVLAGTDDLAFREGNHRQPGDNVRDGLAACQPETGSPFPTPPRRQPRGVTR